MDGARSNHTGGVGHHASGPIVWASIITATCLLLFFFQKILWLVVPFLLALIVYYFLYPPMQSLIYRGMSRDAAASWVTLAFLALLSIVGVALTPWVAAHLAGWQDIVSGYVNGGHVAARPLPARAGEPLADPGQGAAGRYRADSPDAGGRQHYGSSGAGCDRHHGLDAVFDAGTLPGVSSSCATAGASSAFSRERCPTPISSDAFPAV
jgi:hypothetical protein